jgi:cytokinin dehydrogenase
LPRVLPLNLDLTVGGVQSVGGIGASSHLAGAAVSTVRALEVVTGAGEAVKAAVPTGGAREPDLAGSVLGGLGRCGEITGAELELRPCAPEIRTFYLLYDDIDPWLADQRQLLARPRPPDWMEAFTTVAGQGLRNGPQGRRPFGLWFYGLHLSWEHGPAGPERLDAETALAGLRPYRVVHVEEGQTAAFQDRYQPRFQFMRALGGWTEPHPWVEAILPLHAAQEILPPLLAELPLSLGDGHRLMFVAGDRLPFAMAVPEERPLVAFAILPPGLPPPLREPHLAALRMAHDRLVAGGGKRYLSGWLPSMQAQEPEQEQQWQRHFGPKYPGWLAAKRRFDPQGIFSSALFGVGRGEVAGWTSK